ncbi:MAG: outer membrane beta-barrel domain-containing protein [Myxococcaceae bacterium]|jgi:outer membrane beta-barrel protein|nr:outer membrane beta-barrel domain-containing protein [Myxococcaceae bacterium]
MLVSTLVALALTQTATSDAPRSTPAVDVHVIEARTPSMAGRFEVTVFPAVAQLNGLYTQHAGTLGQVTWHVREHFGLMVFGGGNWLSRESAFNGELIGNAAIAPQTAASLLWTWTTMAGVEVTPFYGKFALFDVGLAHFSFVLNGAAGVGGTRHTLLPEGRQAATYGDTGTRFMAALGAGFRLGLGRHVAVRVEVRDVVYTARVDRVNGCTAADLGAGATPGAGCSLSTFDSAAEVAIARGLVRTPTSDVLHSVGAYAGVSVVF